MDVITLLLFEKIDLNLIKNEKEFLLLSTTKLKHKKTKLYDNFL